MKVRELKAVLAEVNDAAEVIVTSHATLADGSLTTFGPREAGAGLRSSVTASHAD